MTKDSDSKKEVAETKKFILNETRKRRGGGGGREGMTDMEKFIIDISKITGQKIEALLEGLSKGTKTKDEIMKVINESLGMACDTVLDLRKTEKEEE